LSSAYADLRHRIDRAAAAAGRTVRLLAVSKTKPAQAIRDMAALGQRAFGENYVQEALTKQGELRDLDLEWHLIGPLQSNKCRDVARHFDWLQSLDREKLIDRLDRYREPDCAPLNVLIQVNIDDETGKSGCRPEDIDRLAQRIANASHLKLRGLMAIPAPNPDMQQRRAAFRRMRGFYDGLRAHYPSVDTLSAGMSDDFEVAIAEGATMVRIGTALFGARR